MKNKKSKAKLDSESKLIQKMFRLNKNLSKITKRLSLVELQMSTLQQSIAAYQVAHVGINRMILTMNEGLDEIKKAVEAFAGMDMGAIDLKVISNLMEEARLIENMAKEEKTQMEPAIEEETSLEVLDLDVRSKNALENAEVKTIGDIRSRGIEGLMSIKNLGKKRAEEIMKEVESLIVSGLVE